MTTKNINNLDLIRLLAAFQVVFGHSISHLDMNTSIVNFLNSWVGIFPGVPIFFVISGFLIVSSYQKSPSYFEYIRNRFLRLYPGLWLCFLITLLIVMVFGFFTAANLKQIILWSLCQLSFFQFYNPEFLRGFGVGVINGSLWTITVELQFYLIAPVLAYLLKKRIHFFIFLFLLMLIVNIISGFLPVADVPDHKYAFVQLIHRLYNVSFVPYLYFFMLGALIKWYWRQLSFLFEGRVAIWLFGYLAICYYFCWWVIFGNLAGYTLILLLIWY